MERRIYIDHAFNFDAPQHNNDQFNNDPYAHIVCYTK